MQKSLYQCLTEEGIMSLNKQIEQAIEKELKQGYMEIEEDNMMSVDVSLEDMELMSAYLQDVLTKQHYKFPTHQEYKEKIKELFDVEFNGDSTILYEQGIGEVEPKTVLVGSSEMSSSIFFLVTQLQLCNAYWSNKNIIKSFTPICMTKLELRHEEKELEELGFHWAYPSNKEEYYGFVHTAYEKSLTYGLETQKDCHAFILAWHVLGEKMIKTDWLIDIINNDDNYDWEKREALLCACYEKLDEVEGD